MACLVAAAFHRNRVFLYVWSAVILVALGFTAAQGRTWLVDAPVLHKKTYPVTVEGKVVSVDPMPKSYRIVLENIAVRQGHIWQDDLPRRVRVRLKPNDEAEPSAGDIVAVKAILQPISPPVLPGAFDFQRYAFFEQLGATGYALGDLELVQRHETGFFFDRLRRYIREHIEADVSDKDHAALLTAFMVGESNGISAHTWDICRRSGIAHLIAISGSHFVLIAGLPFFLLRALLAAIPFIALRWPIKKIAAAMAIAVSVFYMMLIGAPIPAQRAVMSVTVVMLAIMLDRDPFTLRLAAFSAFFILLIEPESLMGASFQLSFAAIVALIAFYEMTREWWIRRFRDENIVRRYASYLMGCAMTTVVASTATSAYALYNFARMPLLAGLAANIVAVPVTSFVTFPAGLFACLMMPLGLEEWPLWVTEKSIAFVMAAAEAVVDWPYAAWQGGAVPAWFLIPVTLGGLWICFWRGKLRAAGLTPIGLAVALLPLTPRPDVLVAENAGIFAVRDAEGKLWFSSGRKEKFVRNEWLQLQGGMEDYGVWPDNGTAGDGFLSCDGGACEYKMNGQIITFIRQPEALPNACGKSGVVFSALALKGETCRYKTVLRDKWDIWRQGAQAVYAEPEGLRIQTVLNTRGVRPWTGKRTRWPVKED
ncbi:MAG: ComEC family competence protein [Alphaproteobacteria bacterium]|nr:MAG: ComEC family competence protein [Alphaproteobacteria bacterium]